MTAPTYTLAVGSARGAVWHWLDPVTWRASWQVVRFEHMGPNRVLGTFDRAEPALAMWRAEVER